MHAKALRDAGPMHRRGVMPVRRQPLNHHDMHLDDFRGKTLDDAMLSKLSAAISTHTEALESRALAAEDKARKAAKESIDGRKGLKQALDKALEKLGVDSADDLDNLPDVKGQAEAARQFETKFKRLQNELAEKAKSFDELSSRYGMERRERAIAEEVARHPFIDAEDVRALVAARLHVEGDETLFKTPDGKTVPLSDGVAWLAKTKTHLVRPAGDAIGGSGFRGTPSTGKTVTRAQIEAAAPHERPALLKGATLVDA